MCSKHRHSLYEVPEKDNQPRTRQRMDNERPVYRYQVSREGSNPCEVHREFLTWDELQTVINKKFELSRIDLVRDIFIFCAFTGLSFIDVKQLTSEHIVKDREGNYWIRKARQKTKNMCNIPLLDVPLAIIEKYKG